MEPQDRTAADDLEGTRDASGPNWRDEHAPGLIDVRYLKGGLWKAICECGEHPEVFAQERVAWQWVTDHACPALESPVVPEQPARRGFRTR